VRGAAVAAAAVAVATLTGVPAYADSGAQHYTFSFDEVATSHVDGLGAGCPAFVGTMTEQRHDELAGTEVAGGTVHGRTLATSLVTLTPDDPSAVSYTGGYVFRETGTYVNDGADDWIETATVRGSLSGSDGSAYRLTEVVHLSVSHDGTVRATFDRLRCTG
jgi:hypothetical protein